MNFRFDVSVSGIRLEEGTGSPRIARLLPCGKSVVGLVHSVSGGIGSGRSL